MTTQTTTSAPDIGITGFPLDQLYLSEMNPRQETDAEGIALLADSIAVCGLIQNLAGLMDAEGRVGIVAGGRRLRALACAFERDPEFLRKRPELAAIPVRLAPDEATARAWASAENAARRDLHPADEIRAYGRMREAGAEVLIIARTFGTTEAQVYRRLALADLPAPVLDALKAGEITLGIAAAFTVANDETLALHVLEQVRGNDWFSEHRVKRLLQPDAVSLSDRRAAFVGLDTYEAAGGAVTRDLFEDSAFLQDSALLDRLFTEKLQGAADALLAEGWKWAEAVEDTHVSYEVVSCLHRLYPIEGELTEEQVGRYDELAELAQAEVLDAEGEADLEALQAILEGDFTPEQRAYAGVFICADHAGQLRIHGAYLHPDDAEAAIEAGILTGHAAEAVSKKTDAAPKSPYSAALVEDMKAARLHAAQAALLAKPELLLDLLAFTLSGRGGAYETLLDLRPNRANITPSKAEGLTAEPRLGDPEAGPGWMEDAERVAAFEAFRAEGKKARNAALAEGLARTFAWPDPRKEGLFQHIEAEAEAGLRQVWMPTAEGFFARVSAGYLDTLMLDLTGCDPQGSGFKAWKAQKKGEKAASMERLFNDADYQKAWHIDAEKLARIRAWEPDCF